MNDPAPRRPRIVLLLAFVVVPIAFLPVSLRIALAAGKASFFALIVSIVIAAPITGFWLGELFGKSSEGRAALGCLGTLIVFAFYLAFSIGALTALPR
jgi:uncharacterized membrane protein